MFPYLFVFGNKNSKAEVISPKAIITRQSPNFSLVHLFGVQEELSRRHCKGKVLLINLRYDPRYVILLAFRNFCFHDIRFKIH